MLLTRIKMWLGRAAEEPAPDPLDLALRVQAAKLTYIDHQGLVDIFEAVRCVEQAGVPGRLIEAGTALGGSAVVLASAKSRSRPLDLYDTFRMIPPPGEKDGEDIHKRYALITSGKSHGIGGDTYYGYRGDLRGEVTESLRRFGRDPRRHSIRLIQGLYQETLRPKGPIALAHIDCDWYDSVWCCFERIWPLLSPGGVLIIDDYSHWSGCRRATDDFVAAHADEVEVRQLARPHLVKLR